MKRASLLWTLPKYEDAFHDYKQEKMLVDMKKNNTVFLLAINLMICTLCLTGCSEKISSKVTGKVSEYVDQEIVDDITAKSGQVFDKLKEEAKAEIKEKGSEIGSELASEIKEKGDEIVREALEEKTRENAEESSGDGILSSVNDIELTDVNGNGTNYVFTYGGDEFFAYYRPDNWQIVDSYLITNSDDMMIICRALSDVHPIHGADMESYRTPEDMAYEWLQHNLAYDLLPEDNYWRNKAKDVDLNPADQGKTLAEMYEIKTGKKLSISDLLH